MSTAATFTAEIRQRHAASIAKSACSIDATAQAAASASELKQFEDTSYYDKARGQYLICDSRGDWFHVPDTLLRRQAKVRGMRCKPAPDEVATPVEQFTCRLQNERAVSYAGPLAGHPKGPRTVNGATILVTSERKPVIPHPGSWQTIQAVLEGMFADGEHDQMTYFYGWLQCSLKALQEGTRKPGQVLVMAGPPECGKSLVQSMITWILGGRECKPYAYMTGATDFNSEIFGAEHLRLDDEQASTDMRTRRAFGARVKELLFGHDQRMHAKNRDAVMLDPTWRMTVSLNEEPENLQVLPPLDESLEDKFTILRAARRPMPMPTGTPAETAAFAAAIQAELPAFVHFLLCEFEIPADLQNDRCGICHWHHPQLLEAIRELSAHSRMLSYIDRELFHGRGLTGWQGTADALEHELTAGHSDVRNDALRLFTWSTACGTFLGRLAKDHPDRVVKVRHRDSREWRILPPGTTKAEEVKSTSNVVTP